MIYPTDLEIKIGFDRVRKWVENYLLMQLSKEKLEKLSFMTDSGQVRAMLSQTNEMKTILLMEDAFPSDGFVDTNDSLRKVKIEGAYLLPDELGALRQLLTGVNAVVSFFGAETRTNKYPFLSRATSKVERFPQIVAGINRIIDSSNEVKDNASPLLAEIRTAIRQKEREATKRLHSIMRLAQADGWVDQEAQIAIRDGRAVIPIPASNKKKIKGLVQDESATGKTAYIEPMEVVEINNEVRELQYDERREVVRILIDFTTLLRPLAEPLERSTHFMSAIDLIRAKAKVAIDMNAYMPIVTDNKDIIIREARHPILERTLRKEGKPIVPLNLTLSPQKHILVISGPNAGGKSVCLKTTGLLQYMMQMGLLVPMSASSEMTVFRKIFIDIGDQQSIDNDLSTYSSHLLNMKNIMRQCDPDSLVMIDEFGGGTEPALGGAIAEVVLERIEKKGAFGVITTHYTNIKYYASNAQGVENGAMAFDVQNIRPLFRLEMGKPGNSFAFEIARNIGLPVDVIKEAEGRIGESQINIERQLRQIARDKNYWETKREKIKQSEKRFEQVSDDYEQKLLQIKEQKADIIAKARRQAEDIISQANKEIERTIREIKEAEAEKNRTREIRQRFDDFKEEIFDDTQQTEIDLDIERKIEQIKQRKARKEDRKKEREEKALVAKTVQEAKPKEKPVVMIGSKVRMQGQGVAGEVIDIERGRATVAFGNLRSVVAVSKLEVISENVYKQQLKSSGNQLGALYGGSMKTISEENKYSVSEQRMNFRSDIDLRGARVDEALTKVQDLVDRAIMLGISDLRILHGKGTGALKEEIRKFLRSNPLVVSARDESVEFGGAGITIVKLDV